MFPERHIKTGSLAHLCHLCQVRINKITRVIRVPLLLVLLYFIPQESHDLSVVGVYRLMWSWQVFHQVRESIIQLLMGQMVTDQQWSQFVL